MTSFPAIYATDLRAAVRFYERLGFAQDYHFPEDDPGYFGLSRGTSRLGLVKRDWPEQQLGIRVGSEPRFELWVYVEDVDAILASLRVAGASVLREAEDMPWGERIAHVADPDGNPVVIAFRPSG